MIFRPANLKTDNYTRIPNLLLRGGTSASDLRSDQISPESLGVLVYLLSHRDDWQITNNQLCTVFGVGNGKMTRITKELETAEYIKRTMIRNSNGHVESWDWLVTDARGHFPLDQRFPDQVKPDQVKPDQVKPDQDNDTQRTNMVKNKQEKEQISWREKLLNDVPEGIPAKAWNLWWEYKLQERKGRKPAKKMITMITQDFIVFKKDDFDLLGVVSFAISRQWKSIGKPDWDLLKSYKGHKRKLNLMEAVK